MLVVKTKVFVFGLFSVGMPGQNQVWFTVLGSKHTFRPMSCFTIFRRQHDYIPKVLELVHKLAAFILYYGQSVLDPLYNLFLRITDRQTKTLSVKMTLMLSVAPQHYFVASSVVKTFH